jgi:serine/threonine-protein kinase
MLYELLTGEKPFPANTPTAVIYKILHEEPIPPRAVEPTIDPALEKVVRKALAKSPFDRYQTCKELQDDLREASREAAKPAAKKAAAPRETKPRPSRAPRKAAAAPAPVPVPPAAKSNRFAITVGVLLLVGIAVFGWQQNWFSPKPSRPEVRQAAPTKPLPQPVEKPPVPVETQAPAKPAPPKQEPVKVEEKKAKGGETPPTTTVQESKPPRISTPAKPSTSPVQQQEVASWLRQAEQYVGRGEYSNAVFALNQVLSIDPNHAEARAMLEKVRRLQERQSSSPQP